MLPKIAESDEIKTVAGSHLRGYRGVAGESRLRPRIVPKDCTTRYYMRVRTDGRVDAVVVWHPVGDMVVFTQDQATGDEHRWGCRHVGVDVIEFYPHPAYVHVRQCVDCKGTKVIGVDPETNPWGSRCGNCEGSGEIPVPVCLVTEKHVVAERIYLEPTTKFFY